MRLASSLVAICLIGAGAQALGSSAATAANSRTQLSVEQSTTLSSMTKKQKMMMNNKKYKMKKKMMMRDKTNVSPASMNSGEKQQK